MINLLLIVLDDKIRVYIVLDDKIRVYVRFGFRLLIENRPRKRTEDQIGIWFGFRFQLEKNQQTSFVMAFDI
ncbi:hypothetical protein Hanom_Chr15g01348241 [Helianthus anomalus]